MKDHHFVNWDKEFYGECDWGHIEGYPLAKIKELVKQVGLNETVNV